MNAQANVSLALSLVAGLSMGCLHRSPADVSGARPELSAIVTAVSVECVPELGRLAVRGRVQLPGLDPSQRLRIAPHTTSLMSYVRPNEDPRITRDAFPQAVYVVKAGRRSPGPLPTLGAATKVSLRGGQEFDIVALPAPSGEEVMNADGIRALPFVRLGAVLVVDDGEARQNLVLSLSFQELPCPAETPPNP